jgi:hypothetical protein
MGQFTHCSCAGGQHSNLWFGIFHLFLRFGASCEYSFRSRGALFISRILLYMPFCCRQRARKSKPTPGPAQPQPPVSSEKQAHRCTRSNTHTTYYEKYPRSPVRTNILNQRAMRIAHRAKLFILLRKARTVQTNGWWSQTIATKGIGSPAIRS